MRNHSLTLTFGFISFVAFAAAPDADYNPIGRRDPFQPPVPQATVRPASSLERFELSQITLEGIISGISDPKATVTVPGGESFLVRKGMRIGREGGRVARITSNELVVAEEQRGDDGVVHVRETALTIRTEQNED